MALLLTPHAATAQDFPVTVTPPAFTGPLEVTDLSYPQLAINRIQTLVDLEGAGYVEEEFLVNGNANTYDWNPDGSLAVRTTATPYTTRILVRRPGDSSRFSGRVIVETVNNARQYDWAFIWALSYAYIMDQGDAYVAVTHTPEAISALQLFDAGRYASLAFPNPTPAESCGPQASLSPGEEGLRWDMISQIGALLKSGTGPLAGFDVSRVYATTHTRELTTYANSVHKLSRLESGGYVYDGFVIKSEYAPADRIRRCAPAPDDGDQRRIVRNAGVPVIRVTAQGDVPETVVVRREDSDDPGDAYRLWEVAGAPHMDKIYYDHMPVVEDQEKAGQRGFLANWPMAYACTPDIDLLDFPVMRHAMNAAFAAMDRWVSNGSLPPRADRISVISDDTGTVSFLNDAHGNAIGGARSVYLEAPIATYPTNSPGPAVCRNLGQRLPFSWPKLESLYGNSSGYSAAFLENLDRLTAQGWLTEFDSSIIREGAEALFMISSP